MSFHISYASLSNFVYQNIPQWIVRKIMREVKISSDEIWGINKKRTWSNKTIMITLYRDLTKTSFEKLNNYCYKWVPQLF